MILMGFNILSTFSGMEISREIFNELDLNVDQWFSSEVDTYSLAVSKYHYSDVIHLGDIKKIMPNELPRIDIIVGGSPCQGFSFAGKQKGMTTKEKLEITTLEQYLHLKDINFEFDGQSYLFWEYIRLLKELKPKYFLLENVGSMAKKDRDIITELLGVKPIKINSKLMSSQLRNRYYWTNIPNVTVPKDKGIKLNDILVDGWSDRENARCLLESESRPLSTPVKMFHRYYSTGFTSLIFKSKQHYLDCVDHYKANFNKLSAKEIDTKLKEQNIKLDVYKGVRYFYQSELEKLQTVPTNYTEILNRNESAGLIGDGWTVDVIAHILSFMEF